MDVDERVLEAASLYEVVLRSDVAPLDAYLNLAFLYWQCSDLGFAGAHHISDEFLVHAGHRYDPILVEADRRFGWQPEIEFWQLYFQWYWTGVGFVSRCAELVLHDSKPTVPFFYLFVESHGDSYRAEAVALLLTCQQCPTAKNRYITSILHSKALPNPLIA